MTPHAKKAYELFLSGYNCAQSTFCAFCDVTGYSMAEALRLSSSFGGGMGRLREVCGACSAIFMVAGILWGYTGADDDAAKGEHYALIQSLAEEFKKAHGTIICRELLDGIESSTSPIPSARTKEYYASRPCARFVASAATILDREIERRNKMGE